jgi:isorenieratene synthase
MSQSLEALFAQTIARRNVLKLFGFGSVAALLGYSRLSKPEPTVFQKDHLELPGQTKQSSLGGG